MGARKIATTIVLIAITAGALYFAVQRLSPEGEPKPPPFRDKISLIDINSGVIMTKPRAAWTQLGAKDGVFLNPDTNQYTMVTVMNCGNCRAPIPWPSPPREAMIPVVNQAAIDDWEANLKCPKCGKNPFELLEPTETPQKE